MINHVEQFKRVKETFEDFEKEYKTFKKKYHMKIEVI